MVDMQESQDSDEQGEMDLWLATYGSLGYGGHDEHMEKDMQKMAARAKLHV